MSKAYIVSPTKEDTRKILSKIKSELELLEVCNCPDCKKCGHNFRALKLLENSLWMILEHTKKGTKEQRFVNEETKKESNGKKIGRGLG